MDKQTQTLPTDVDELQRMLRESIALNESLATATSAKETDLLSALSDARNNLREEQKEGDRLREMLRLYLQKRFGPSSEKWSEDQLQIFNEAEADLDPEDAGEEVEEVGSASEDSSVPTKPKTPRKKGRRPLPDWLERRDVIHDLSADEKICPNDGQELTRIGEETSEQLEYVPATLQVIRNVRPKYACSKCEDGVRIAEVPPQAIPKSMASPSLLANIAVSKYCDALPLYRQAGILERADISISRTTMANWMMKIGEHVQPIINLLRDELLAGDVVHCDETRVQVLKENGKTAQSQSYMWAQRSGEAKSPVILFDYDPSRGGDVPKKLFEGFSGWLHVDGYAGYNALFDENRKIIRVGCMAHCRRKFDESIKAQSGGKKKSPKQKKGATKSHQGFAFIRKLYKIEKDVRGQSPEVRKAARQKLAVPILTELKAWLDKTKSQVPPRSLTGQAIGYMLGQWESLVRYVDDGRLEIDNNKVENAIRPFVVGRRNWLFSDTVRGAESSANLYSIIETAKANGLEPYRYLCHLLTELSKAKSVEEMEALMPTRWKPSEEECGS